MRIALSKYTEENVAAIQTLHPNVRDVFLEFLWRCALAGIYVRIYSARRTIHEQNRLYAKGRTESGRKVTNAWDDFSFHVHGLAIDIVPLWRLGPVTFSAAWDWRKYAKLDKIAKEIGIEHPLVKDQPHFIYTGGLMIGHVRAGQLPDAPNFEVVHKPPELLRAIERLGLDV